MNQAVHSPPSRLAARVAFASADGTTVNQHFGSARRFVIVDLGPHDPAPVLDENFQAEAQDGNEDKLIAKLGFLRAAGVHVLVCAQVGQSAAKQLLAQGIQPMAVTENPPIDEVIARLHFDLQQPAAWTKRLPKSVVSDDSRLASLLNEDWEG